MRFNNNPPEDDDWWFNDGSTFGSGKGGSNK
jgi:hypothetical protein